MFKLILRKALNQSECLGSRLKRSGLRKHRLGRTFVDFVLLPSDIGRVLQCYRAEFGTYPNIISPRDFNEYLQQTKLLNRKRFYSQWADKFLARDYVAERIGRQYLNELIWRGDDLRTVDREKLPQSFIIKANNGWDANIIVHDKDSFDWQAAYRTSAQWLEGDHSALYGEWQYRWIPPQLIIERLLVGDDGGSPTDYKFFVFHGKVEFVQVDFGRFSNHTRNLYDRNFGKLDVVHDHPNLDGPVSKPSCFDEMIRLAEMLANNERFVRVDFYDDNGRPIFGELTLHPHAGLFHFEPPSFNDVLGRVALRKEKLEKILAKDTY